jgi:hypothetical protein
MAGNLMINLIIFAFCLLLAGCATEPPQPQIIYDTKEVKIPVFVPCKFEPILKPPITSDNVKPIESRAIWLKAELIDFNNLRAYSLELETALNKCVEPIANE